MDDYYLVASHISPLSSIPPLSFVVQTTRQNAPLAAGVHDNDLPIDHATCSSVLTTPATGTILLRVIHGGLIVELISLSTPVPPLRIVFPATVLPAPSLFLWGESELHLILATDIRSLHRLIIPIDGLKLWQNQVESIWSREYAIRNLPAEHTTGCAVHVQGTHCVAISLPNGVLLRLEAESMGYDSHDEEWAESIFHHGSFLSSLTAFLPLHSSTPNAADIISLASHPWPTDILNVWTLSRDRTLRLWKPKLGCVASKTLPPSPNMKDLTVSGSFSGKYLLLDAEQQNLVKVFSLISEEGDRVDIYVLVFIPTPSSTSGGFFCLLDSSSDHLVEVGMIECPKHTAHCHLQDFTINGNKLYALWDRQGQSMVERAEIDIAALKMNNVPSTPWKTSYYAHEPELTPAYMEEQLISRGSLSEKFLQAIMKPGVFSSLTLRTALDKYVDACLSIPGPPPPQLLNTYSSLCENIAAVVGCTVTLNRDPQTGGFQYANYWTALKRDWEGFVARCREVERSARWPLAIAAHGEDQVLVVERERMGSLVTEDVPIYLRRSLERDQPLHIQYELLGILWALRSKLGPTVLTEMETQIVDILHQETAFSFAEVLQDTANQIKLLDVLDEGSQSWFAGRLQSIADMDTATRNALDSIGSFDLAIKHEYTDNELLHPPPSSEWIRSQSAAYVTTTVGARYDLCLCLIISLLFQAESLPMWDASLLAEVFAVFRGLAMLRFIGNQPAEAKNPQNAAAASADDVVAQMRNMNVSSNKHLTTSKSSLMHHLISQSQTADGIASIAHNFLDATGLLQSISPAHATKHEILFCDRIQKLGFYNTSMRLLGWLPRTPAATFLQAQILLTLGRVDDASQLFEKLAGAFGISNLTLEDSDALVSVLPLGRQIDSQWSFYVFAADLFRNTFVHHEVLFSQLAIQVAPPGAETGSLWNTVVKGYMDLGLYSDAYASIMTMPFEKQKRECASQLAIRMCEENAVQKLMNFDFVGIAGEVEAALAFKARNADPRIRPSYSRILYTWYTRRGDYRNASLTMYQRARKLQDVITDVTSFIALAEDQLEALSVAVNALNLVDEKNAWVLMPIVSDTSRKRQKLSKHIPESKYMSNKHDAEIIHLSDMEYDCALLRAQIDSVKQDPSILSSPEYLLPPSLIVMRLAKANQYDQAMAIAQSLKVDMTDVFNHLTNQCLRLSRNPGSVLQEDTSGWLLTDNAASWQGTPSDRGWRYLQQSLKRYDSAENDYRYAKASLERFLKYQPEYLIRISLRYENIADAVNYTYALLLKSDKQLSREATKQASASWLPYALIDQVLIAADTLMNPPGNLSQLRAAINARVKRMQKFSQNVS
ncbi:nucleoporin Nup120/160-domain-containing protein [Pholiota molesta]|nr:nucleoporin Nup120/160-domain-containing protein [Pholiota molesta]